MQSLGRRSPTLLGRGYGGYVLPAPPSNVVPFPNPRPVNPDTERIQKELREKEAQKRVAVLKVRALHYEGHDVTFIAYGNYSCFHLIVGYLLGTRRAKAERARSSRIRTREEKGRERPCGMFITKQTSLALDCGRGFPANELQSHGACCTSCEKI